MHPRPALRVVMGQDGLLHVGPAGRIRVGAPDPVFVEGVIADLGRIVSTPEGSALVEHGDGTGSPILVVKPDAATDPPNAWTERVEAPAAGPEALTGSMGGGHPGPQRGRTVRYDPADWPRRGDSASPSSAEVLLRLLRETDEGAPPRPSANATPRSADPLDRPRPGRPGRRAANTASRPSNLQLSCRCEIAGHHALFTYSVQNMGEVDVYVMDATPSVDPRTRDAQANDQAALVMLTVDGDLVVGKFMAPLPTDRRVAVPVVPLASRLQPGETLERLLRMPTPLTETTPYLPDRPRPECEVIDISDVVFTIGYWVAGSDDLAVAPASYAPDLFAVTTGQTGVGAARLRQRLSVLGLQVCKRRDAFPRALTC